MKISSILYKREGITMNCMNLQKVDCFHNGCSYSVGHFFRCKSLFCLGLRRPVDFFVVSTPACPAETAYFLGWKRIWSTATTYQRNRSLSRGMAVFLVGTSLMARLSSTCYMAMLYSNCQGNFRGTCVVGKKTCNPPVARLTLPPTGKFPILRVAVMSAKRGSQGVLSS